MRRIILKISLLVAGGVFVLSAFGLNNPSRNNPNVRNPVGSSPTRPRSSVSSGLHRSPNPLRNTGNNIIAGNVGGGKHFRGSVPYRSRSDFYDSLGSTSLDSFLRRSQRSSLDNYYGYTGGTTPFYSPTGTINRPTDTSGQSPLRLPSTRLDSSVEGGTHLSDAYKTRMPDAGNQKVQNTLGISPGGTHRLRSPAWQDYENRFSEGKPETWGYREQTTEKPEQYRENELREDARIGEKPAEKPKEETAQREFTEQTRKQKQEDSEQPADVYEQMLNRLEELRKRTERTKESLSETRKQEESKDTSETEKQEAPEKEKTDDKVVVLPRTGKVKALENMTQEEITEQAEGILGEHRSFASYADSRFNQYMLLAEQRMQKGKYYMAADAYSIAIEYKKDDPLPYAGKCHALFAAGEYMSSALFLSRTLDMFPEYPLFDIDLEAMFGGKDIIDTRIADIKDWLRVAPGEVPELRFLLAYIYYQLDRTDAAVEQIDLAYEQKPDDKTIKNFYDIIHSETG